MLKVIVFDWDGTLSDEARNAKEAGALGYGQFLEQATLPHSIEVIGVVSS